MNWKRLYNHFENYLNEFSQLIQIHRYFVFCLNNKFLAIYSVWKWRLFRNCLKKISTFVTFSFLFRLLYFLWTNQLIYFKNIKKISFFEGNGTTFVLFFAITIEAKKMFQIYYKGGVVTCKKHLCTLHNTSTHSSNWTTLYCFDWILLRFYIFFLGFFCRDLYFEVFFLDIEQICCLISSYYDFDWARRYIWLLCDVERR